MVVLYSASFCLVRTSCVELVPIASPVLRDVMPTATVVDVHALPVMLHTSHVQELTGLSMPMVYGLLNRKGCPVLRFGRSIRVLRDPFLKWLEDQTVETLEG